MRTQPESKTINLSTVTQERAILYARVSNDDRKNATSSIDSQLSDGRKYASEQGYNIIAELFEEPNKQTSGADWLPRIEEILKLAKQQTFDVLVAREIDRLARNRFKQLSVENTLDSYGVRVEYYKGQYEDTPEGNLLKGMMGEFAEYERNKTRERTMYGKIRAVEAGNVTIGGSRAPYGYDLVKREGQRVLVINEQEAAIVRLIFDMYVNQRLTLYAIGDYLDRHHIPKPGRGIKRKTEKQTGWSPSTISGILSNETYVGRWYYRKFKRVKNPKTGKRSRDVMRPKSEWLMVEVPAIVDEDIFKAAQSRRDENKRERGKKRKHKYLLGGMCRCGHCGHGVTGATKTDKTGQRSYYVCCARHHPKRYTYRCNDSVSFRRDVVEDAVWKWIKSILIDESYLDLCLDKYEQEYEKSKQPVLDMIKANRAKLNDLEEAKDRLIKGYCQGVFTLDEIAKEKTDIDRQIANIKKAIVEIEGDLGPERLTQEDKDKTKAIAAKIRQGVDLAGDRWDVKRELFEILHVQVSLVYEDGKRWADVTCILDEDRIPTDYTSPWCRLPDGGNRWSDECGPSPNAPNWEKIPAGPFTVSIYEAKRLPLGAWVRVRGRVTAPPGVLGTRNMYIQDETAGILIYLPGEHGLYFTLGDKVEVVGNLSTYHEEFEIVVDEPADVEHLETGQPPPSLPIATTSLLEPYEGMLVMLQGQAVHFKGRTTMWVDDGTGWAQIYIRRSTGIKKPFIEIGTPLTVVGIVSQYSDQDNPRRDDYRLLPRYPTDLILPTPQSSPANWPILLPETGIEVQIK